MNFFINKSQSYYSLLDSTISIDKLIDATIKTNCPYVFLVDKNMSGAIEFYYKARAANLTPIIGLEINYKNNIYILIAKNNNGYKNLNYISSAIETKTDYELDIYLDDLIIVLKKGDLRLRNHDFYFANELALNEVRYINREEHETYKTLISIDKNVLLDDVELNIDYSFLNYETAINIFDETLINKTNKLLIGCHWNITDQKLELPKYKTSNNISSKKELERLCINGLKTKLNLADGLIDKKYVERLIYELNIINKMNFNDYFLIVQDFVNYAKSKNILIGPGRGSAAGSLVSYALNITDVDPIKNNLIFERFLNPERSSLPDIDVDVMDIRRQEVIDYIFSKYGKQNCCYIATFQRIKAKMAIRDVGRSLEINLKIIDSICKLISNEYDNDLMKAVEENKNLQTFYNSYKKLFLLANSLINIPRQISTHAAGIVISSESICNKVAIRKGIDEWYLSQTSMEYIEKAGLIKIDILGLKNLSIISDIVKSIEQSYQQIIDLTKIDFDDKKLFNEISNARTIGIFQLESPGMRSTLKKVKVNSIEDISIVSALFRPGPQAMINDYVKTKNGELKPNYINKNLEIILKPTLGFCIYQEQVIELIKIVANFSMSEADIFRRAISKKKEELFLQMKEKFIDGAIKNNYTNEQAKKIYDFLIEFANYGFNHSHSLCYAYISYQMMYLKYYYPLEFFLTLLKFGDSSNQKNLSYISEAKSAGIKIYNISLKHSDINFSKFNNGIIFGFANIKGIGYEIAKKIISIRNDNDFKNYLDTIVILSSNGINKKTIESLIKVGAFDEYKIDRLFLLINLDEIIENAIYKTADKFVFGLDLKETDKPMSDQEKFDYELFYLGYTFSNNLYQKVFDKIKNEYNLASFDEGIKPNTNYLINVLKTKVTMTKYNKKMSFINFELNNITFETTCFNQSIIELISANKFYVVNLEYDRLNKPTIKKIINQIDLENLD